MLTFCDPLESVETQLPLEACDLGLFEVTAGIKKKQRVSRWCLGLAGSQCLVCLRRQDLLHEFVSIVDTEGPAMPCPANNLRQASLFRLLEHPVKLNWERIVVIGSSSAALGVLALQQGCIETKVSVFMRDLLGGSVHSLYLFCISDLAGVVGMLVVCLSSRNESEQF